jgi:hypothetical protein
MNVKEMTVRQEERPTLVQHWILVSDEQGNEHLEARWVVESETHAPVTHAA